MMRRMGHALLMAVLLVLTLGVAAPAQAGNGDPRSIEGTLVETTTVFPATGTWDPYEYFNPSNWKSHWEVEYQGRVVIYDCEDDAGNPVDAAELVVGTATGDVSRLGKVTRWTFYCTTWDLVTYMPNPPVAFTQVMIAANGDTLEIGSAVSETYEYNNPTGDFWDGWYDFAVEVPIIGGTGRFADASGTLYETGQLAPDFWPPYEEPWWEGPWEREASMTYTPDSYIIYDASNRGAK